MEGIAIELYRQFRPKRWAEVIGQKKAVKQLRNWLDRGDFPHALLLTGPSGCGKNTVAGILQSKLECHKDYYKVVDAASFRGIDMVRQLQSSVDTRPMLGKTKIWVIDEVHMMTKEAQNAVLNILENPPDHLYLILNTTDPAKLIKPIKTRTSQVQLNSIDDEEMGLILRDMVRRANIGSISVNVYNKIIEIAKGSARKAIVILDQIKDFESTKGQLDGIQDVEEEKVAFDLAKLLMRWGTGKVVWSEAVELLDKLKNEEPEKMRRLILSCLVTEVKKGGKVAQRACHLYEIFRDHWFDTGYAGLCFTVYASSSAK